MEFNYILVFELIIGVYAAIKAHQKSRNPLLWFVLGTVFSVIALAVIMMMPKKEIHSASEAREDQTMGKHRAQEDDELARVHNLRPFMKQDKVFTTNDKIAQSQ